MTNSDYQCNSVEKNQFQGTHNLSVDDKGRIVIPKAIREKLEKLCDGLVVMTKSIGSGSITVYPEPEYVRIRDKLLAEPDMTPQYQKLVGIMVGTAHDCEILKTGRILVPMHLRKICKIDSDAVIVGVGPRLELWNSEKWNEYIAADNDSEDEKREPILKKLF